MGQRPTRRGPPFGIRGPVTAIDKIITSLRANAKPFHSIRAMSPRPQLSIVVPTHDTRELTLACLASVAAEARDTTAEIEALVVDDGSRDGTAEAVVSRHPEIRVLRHEQRRGFSAAANRGLAAAHGDVLLLLNSDTEVLQGSLATLLEAFRSDPRLTVAGASLRYPDGRPQWSGGPLPTLPWLFALASGLPAILGHLTDWRRLRPPRGTRGGPVDWVTGAALATRRGAWERHGPLDEDFDFYGQDLDYCWRVGRAGGRIEVLPRFVVVHHHGATIGQRAGTSRARQHPELLWRDLLLWGGKARGDAWQRHARAMLRWGASLRIWSRTLATPWLPPARRDAWRRETEAYRRARAVL